MPQMHRGVFKTQATTSFGNASLSQIVVLELLKERGSMKMKDIAKPLSITTSAVTGLVDKMSKTGLLKRKANLSDRRVINIEMTKKGSHMINEIEDEKEKLLVRLFSKLTQRERDDYIRILEKICNNLKHIRK